MKVNEIRDYSMAELEGSLADLKKELFNLRFQNATNQLENPMASNAMVNYVLWW